MLTTTECVAMLLLLLLPTTHALYGRVQHVKDMLAASNRKQQITLNMKVYLLNLFAANVKTIC